MKEFKGTKDNVLITQDQNYHTPMIEFRELDKQEDPEWGLIRLYRSFCGITQNQDTFCLQLRAHTPLAKGNLRRLARPLIATTHVTIPELQLILEKAITMSSRGNIEEFVIKGAMNILGFQIIDTGGNCEAYERKTETGYILITQADGPHIPESIHDEIQVAFYSDDHELQFSFECLLSHIIDEEIKLPKLGT